MKIRKGFVSNSSSSSFVVVGFVFPRDEFDRKILAKKLYDIDVEKDDWEDKYDDADADANERGIVVLDNSDCAPDCATIIGFEIARTDDCGTIDEKKIGVSGVLSKIEELRKKLDVSENHEVDFVCGTRVT